MDKTTNEKETRTEELLDYFGEESYRRNKLLVKAIEDGTTADVDLDMEKAQVSNAKVYVSTVLASVHLARTYTDRKAISQGSKQHQIAS